MSHFREAVTEPVVIMCYLMAVPPPHDTAEDGGGVKCGTDIRCDMTCSFWFIPEQLRSCHQRVRGSCYLVRLVTITKTAPIWQVTFPLRPAWPWDLTGLEVWTGPWGLMEAGEHDCSRDAFACWAEPASLWGWVAGISTSPGEHLPALKGRERDK